jgi:hypothetical protein
VISADGGDVTGIRLLQNDAPELYSTPFILNDPDFFLSELDLEPFLLGLPELQVSSCIVGWL